MFHNETLNVKVYGVEKSHFTDLV